MKRTVIAAIAVVLSASHAVAQPRLTMDWKSMAERLVAQLAPEPGEQILLVARPGHFEQLIPPLRYALRSVGAVDLGVIDVIAEPYPTDWDGAVSRSRTADFLPIIFLKPPHASCRPPRINETCTTPLQGIESWLYNTNILCHCSEVPLFRQCSNRLNT